MSLRLIYGRAGSGKSYFCLNDIKENINSGVEKPLLLIVPEQFTLQAERNLTRAIGGGGIIKVEVLSFRRLAYRVFNEVGGVTHRHISPAGKCMLLFRVMDRMKEGLKVFGKSVTQKGFVSTVSNTITEFKRHNVTPELLNTAIGNAREKDLLLDKLAELNAIYTEFENVLNESYMDTEDDLTELCKKLESSTQYNGAEIWIDEFSGFTPQEYRVIEALLKKAVRVNISLCIDCVVENESVDETDVYSPVKYCASKLLKLARNNNIQVEEPIVHNTEPFYRFKDSKEIMHLEKQLFSYPYRLFKGKTQDISLFSAVNIYSEVENTARTILGLCRGRGIRFREIAVVTGDLSAYGKLVEVIFSQYGIPHFIDSKKEIDNHPLIILVMSIFEVFEKNWSYESVFKYLKTGLTDISREEVDILENYVLACGIKGSKWTQPDDWNYLMESTLESQDIPDTQKEILKIVNDIRKRLVQPLMDFRFKTRGRRKPRDICSAIFEHLCTMKVPERLEERLTALREAGELDRSNEYSQVWNILMEVFDQAVEVLGEQSCVLEEFGDILGIGLGEYKIGIIPPALDQVLVGSLERSKSHEVSALFILGVNDGKFPSSCMEEGIISDKEREYLSLAGLEIASDTRSRAFDDQFLIYTALTTPGKYLRLSCPIADHEGKTLRPSVIVSKLKRIFPDILESSNIISSNTDEENLELIAAPVSTFNEVVSAVRRRTEGFEVSPLWWDVYRWYMKKEEWSIKCMTAVSGLSYSNHVKPIDAQKAVKLYGNPLYSSVSRLEKYVSCPFSYYIQYGLKARERKVYKLSPPDLGIFMHTVIDRLSARLEQEQMSWRTIDKEWCTEAVSQIADDLLKKMSGSVFNSSQRYRYLAGRLKRILARAVWLIAEHFKRSGFEPIGYEVGFGDNEKYPPISIELPDGGSIQLTGRIDRVDALKSDDGIYVRIVDYKSGNKAFKLDDVYYGLQIQLITYLDAVWNNMDSEGKTSVKPGGILYFKLDDPIVKGKGGIQEEDIERAIMKQLKMKGLLLADVRLIKEMDRQIDGDSLIIPARLNKGDVLGRSSAATFEQFELLRKYVKKLLARIGEEILSGDVSIKPYKKKRVTSCGFCSYASVCQFDTSLKDNKYRLLNEQKDDEIWEKLKSTL